MGHSKTPRTKSKLWTKANPTVTRAIEPAIATAPTSTAYSTSTAPRVSEYRDFARESPPASRGAELCSDVVSMHTVTPLSNIGASHPKATVKSALRGP